MNKKSLVISIISTFCLTSIIFLTIPVHSYTPYTYDPWLDVNDDGKINVIDTFTENLAYGTTGDPAKNVIIQNHTTYQWTGGKDVHAGDEWTIINSTNGYSKITVIVQVFVGGSHVTLNVQWFIVSPSGPWPVGYNIDTLDLTTNGDWGKTYDTAGSEIHLVLHNHETVNTVTLVVGIYMTT